MQPSTMFVSVDLVFGQSGYELVVRGQVQRGYLYFETDEISLEW